MLGFRPVLFRFTLKPPVVGQGLGGFLKTLRRGRGAHCPPPKPLIQPREPNPQAVKKGCGHVAPPTRYVQQAWEPHPLGPNTTTKLTPPPKFSCLWPRGAQPPELTFKKGGGAPQRPSLKSVVRGFGEGCRVKCSSRWASEQKKKKQKK